MTLRVRDLLRERDPLRLRVAPLRDRVAEEVPRGGPEGEGLGEALPDSDREPIGLGLDLAAGVMEELALAA